MSRLIPTEFALALKNALWPVLPVIVAAAWSCGASTTRSELGSSSAIVYGSVTTDAGAPVAGATIRGQVWREGSCGSGSPTGSGQPDIVQTNDIGYYRQKLRAADVRQYCVTVDVQPPAGAAVDSTTVSETPVDFKDSRDVPYDSVRVDIVLSQRP